MKKFARAVAALVWLAAACANAQTTFVSPSPAQRCLTRGELLLGTPSYPELAYEHRASGNVTVELEFKTPDAAPTVRSLEAKSEQGEGYGRLFRNAVREFVETYRVPCLKPDETSRLTQEFVFVPHSRRGVAMMASSSEAERRAHRQIACLVKPKEVPDYPRRDQFAERQGTAVVRVGIDGADAATRVTVLDDGGSESFGTAAREHALGYRLPCHDGAGAAEFVVLYVFNLQGAPRVILKDTSLLALLRSLKGVTTAAVYFDFKEMGCPFDLQFTPMQPHAPNRIGEVGRPDPERRFFLDWLSRQQLGLPPSQLNAVLGQTMLVNVPCTVLNLGSSSGGSASQ